MDFAQRVQRLVTEFERHLTELARSMAEQVVAAGVAAANEVARRTLIAHGARSAPVSTEPSPAARSISPRRSPLSPTSPLPAAPPRTSSPRSSAARAATRSPRPRARSEKRKPGERSDLRERIVQCVQRQPGLSVEELNRELGTTTEEVQPPLRMLLTRGVLRTEGELPAARYFPQTRGWAASAPPRR